MIDFRDNWRIVLLVVLAVVAGAALFGPLAGGGEQLEGTEQVVNDPTNLQYGLELSGGSRIRGQLAGTTVDDASIGENDRRDIELGVAEELGLEPIDVTVRVTGTDTATVEVFTNVTDQRVVDALGAAGVEIGTGDVRAGVTEDTRDRAVSVLENRINEVGLSGGSVTTVSQPGGGEHFIVVEAPGINRSELRDLIGDPGRVQIVATWPNRTADGNVTYDREEVLTEEDFDRIGTADAGNQGQPSHVPVTLSTNAADRFIESMNRLGFTSGEGIGNCRWRQSPDDPGYCLLTVVDGEAVYGASMSRNFGNDLRTNPEAFRSSPDFQMQTLNFDEAQELRVNLEAGSLPTELQIQTETFISPSLAQEFKPLAALTALAAWLTVSGVVFYWYRDIRVAVPMLVTAFAEVWILLGFAAAVGLAMDLSHIAGLIAVIGTGLDDLIIMADEILQRKENVKTGRIFQNRYRKAFWVIGMAAATTLIAMSPLAVLSLGDLRGFAIITIVGVIIGVGVTRPAYGDILRHLMLDDVKRK